VGLAAWRAALAEDVVDLLARLAEAQPAIAAVSADLELAREIAWPGTTIYEVPSATVLPVLKAAEGAGRGGEPGQPVEVVAFRVTESQRAGERGHHLRRGVHEPPLLQAHHVVDGDAGELGELLPAHALGPVGPAGDSRGQAVTPRAQGRTELVHRCHCRAPPGTQGGNSLPW